MKYTYMSKTYKLKNKLKILLTILLAVLISTTGYLLSKNVLSKLDYEYFNETTTDGIDIKVVGERGVIPNNSTLKIDKVSKEEKDIVDDSINEIKNNNMNTVESYTYDIKILDEEEKEIEPSDEIKIIFTNDLIDNKNLDTNIYHTSTDDENNLTTEVLKGEVEKDTITTKTDSFSYYTVEFTYDNLTYSIEGASEVKLLSILEQVGLDGEVNSVEGSNDSLFSFEKKYNEWYVISHQAFQTREWMKVTIDDIEYEIIVTDATNYTITYQSGSNGKFAGGFTTNVVSYSMTQGTVTKYSHTLNVDDTGLQNGNYANSLNTNEVVTIPGATTLTVDIYYNGESVSYDWLSVWAGNYPSYTASGNTTSTGYVTTDMGAPNNNNKFGGSQSGSYTVNGNSLTNMGHTTLTITGNSVTFGFISDSSGAGKGYGYYAIVSGFGEIRTITSGTYKEPIPNDSEYRFKEWSQDPDTITTNTTLTATYVEDLLNSSTKGTYDGVDWKIKYDGTLIIGKAGTTQSYTNNTSRRDDSWPWYQYNKQITGIEFVGAVNGNGSHIEMFDECFKATHITNLSNFNTSNVTNMYGMFSWCMGVTNIDVSNFNTSNVTSMARMFLGCYSLTSIDVSNFDTRNVTNMSNMFKDLTSIVSIDVSNFNTSKVTNMSDMFGFSGTYTQNLQHIIGIENFDTSSVTNMSGMFSHSMRLASLDVSNFDTSNVTNMSSMFSWCSDLVSIDVSNFDTSKVTNMSDMFSGNTVAGTTDLSMIVGIENFNTSNVTNMSSMFSGCGRLKSLDVSNFDTSKVTNMNSMFESCRSLISLDLSNFDTSNVTNMNSMFESCDNLTSLDLSNFDTSNVTNMNSMFESCDNLTSLDLSNFDTSKVTTMMDMFTSTTKLNTLKLGTDWNFLTSNGLTKTWLRDGDTTLYTAAELTNSYDGSTMAGTYRAVQLLTITETVKGSLADINKNFNFTINVTSDGVGINSTHAYTGTKSGNLVFSNGVANFTLKHNDSINTYLPYGVSYTITQNSDGYTLSKTNGTGTLSTDRTASFTDTLNGTTPTGIFLDLIPFIIILISSFITIMWIKKFKYI